MSLKEKRKKDWFPRELSPDLRVFLVNILHQRSLQKILEDYLFILKKRPTSLVWKYDSEDEPQNFDFSFTSHLPTPFLESFYEKDTCTLCSRRISYKTGQFVKSDTKNIPLLILLHNTFLSQKKQFYHEPESNQEFQNMLKSIWKEPQDSRIGADFLVREMLRCHFGSEEISNQEWIQNCQTHIQNDIEKYSIRGIWVIGEAAPLLFKEKEELNKRMNQISNFMGLPTIVTYGPSRIAFMKRKKYPKEKIDEVREGILEQIKNFFKQYLNIFRSGD